jgi:hypothetical protein
MSTTHQIEVFFHNLWGSDIYDVKVEFSTSKAHVGSHSYSTECVTAGGKWGPLVRHYETGPHAAEFDYWYVEFSTSKDPSGMYSGSNKFACVIDSEVPPSGHIDLWVSGKDQAFYTGYPDASGMRPGVSGYSGSPRENPGGDYTCYSKLVHTDTPVDEKDCVPS